MGGFYKDNFYLNFDRKKDKLKVKGSADKIIIIPDLLEVFTVDELRKSHAIPFSVSLGCESKFFHLVEKSLGILVKGHTDYHLLYEIIRETNFLKIKEAGNGREMFPGEHFANIIQSATGLRMEYIDCFILGLNLELFISKKLGILSDLVYRSISETLGYIRMPEKRKIDIHTLIELVLESERHFFPLVKGFGVSSLTSINSDLLEGIIKEFIID